MKRLLLTIIAIVLAGRTLFVASGHAASAPPAAKKPAAASAQTADDGHPSRRGLLFEEGRNVESGGGSLRLAEEMTKVLQLSP